MYTINNDSETRYQYSIGPMTVRHPVFLGFLAYFCLLAPTAAESQGTQSGVAAAPVRGSVLDASHAPVAAASVTAVDEHGARAGATATNQEGAFVLTLAPGHYTVRISAVGFDHVQQRITIPMSVPDPVRFVLQVAPLTEAVTVVASAGASVSSAATKTPIALRDVPQSVTVVTQALIQDQMMTSLGDVMRYVPGVGVHQGENNRDQVIMRGNSSSADFFVDGVRDDGQYYRDLYNLDRVEAIKGPNALMFGRGGAGGVVNRVSKAAGFRASRELSMQGGMFGHKRITAGINHPLTETTALRLDAMIEDSTSFRDFVSLRRYGATPTLTYSPTARTKVTVRYEHLSDSRTADRGVTSFQGVPADVDVSTYYGNPEASLVSANIHMASGTVTHQIGALTLRNHTLIGNYDRSYQNFVPGAVLASKAQVTLTAYSNATNRTNLFNQADAIAVVSTGRVRHTLLTGAEFGHQVTDNLRNTGFFNDSATSLLVPYADPTIATPVTFRQSPTDADNHVTANVSALYGQDQVELSRYLLALAGLRLDRFELTYHNNRNGDTLERTDHLISPRAGLVFRPLAAVSLYGSYSVSALPSSGDQFSSLTAVTEQIRPEHFRNVEVGVKWDAAPDLSLTAAVYRLNRTNTRSTDPNDPTRIVQTGAQRTEGYELGVNGRITSRWSIAGGYASQDAFVTKATMAAAAGARAAQVPRHTLSLWNNYRVHPRLSAGIGVLARSDMFAAIDNAVRVPGYTRLDAAWFFTLARGVRLQANIENLFGTAYFINADGNTNISPGSPRAVRVGFSATF